MKQVKRRLCRECGEAKPLRAFYAGRWICRECIGEQAKRAYRARTRFRDREPFICRQCGRTKPAERMSTYADGLCKACHAENLLARKAAAPDMLKCRVCKATKPKEEFERYSVTRCRACAARAVNQYGKENDDE